MRTYCPAAITGLILVSLLAGAAAAEPHQDVQPYTPGPETLGIDENDVRDEPSHHDDDNGFEGDHAGPFWSPKTDELVLDGYVASGTGYARAGSVDASNIINVVLHGENHDEAERTMFPGLVRYAAWWGWWSDTGGGGHLQVDPATSDLPGVGDPNGAIDDADDCDPPTWDEFTWRGPNDCADVKGHPTYPDDAMYSFVQPGTHIIHANTLILGTGYEPILATSADEPTEPDIRYRFYGGEWETNPRPLDIVYDSSLLITTEVVTAVNPQEIEAPGGDQHFDPYEPAGGLEDPERDHAVDVDVYTTPHPAVERAYRTAVWDPGDERDSPVDALHPAGPKGWAKHELVSTVEGADEDASEAVDAALTPTEGPRGLGDDLVQGPRFHEPNTAGDQYGFDTTGSPVDWATHDPATSYGGLDGDYYEPGPDQAYPGYQAGERFWIDAQVTFADPMSPDLGRLAAVHATPQAPSPSEPVESTTRQEDGNTQGPSLMSFNAITGTWYDANGDTWVGDAGEDGHPYDNGTTDDPDSIATDEFRGSCLVDMKTTLYPTSDADGDGTNDWGAAGVYVIDPWTFTYGAPWMDVVGHAADPALDPFREDEATGDLASTLFPERDRLAQYRTEGPIELRTWRCQSNTADSPGLVGNFAVVLPTGTLDFTFEAVTQATLEDQGRTSQNGDNKGTSLTGQAVADVDRFDPMVPAGS